MRKPMRTIVLIFICIAAVFLSSCTGNSASTSKTSATENNSENESIASNGSEEADEVSNSEMIYALDPDAFFGVEGTTSEDGLEYYMDIESHDIAEAYVGDSLIGDYGFKVISAGTVETDDGDTDTLLFELGYGENETDVYISVYASNIDDGQNLVLVSWDEDAIQWVTPDGYVTDEVLYESEEEVTAEQASSSDEESVDETDSGNEENLPPAMDEVFSYLYLESDDQYDEGNPFLTYNGCDSTDEVLSTIEEYIEQMSEYGYSLITSEQRSSSAYVYYLENSDTSLETITYKGQTCHMVIKGLTNDSYELHAIYVFYSPSIVDFYRSVDDSSTSDSSSDSSGSYNSDSNSSGSEDSGFTMTCIKCHGKGTITCTNCDGIGFKEEKVSTPNYSGHTSTMTGSSKQTCFKCHGSGVITCPSCDGSGTR